MLIRFTIIIIFLTGMGSCGKSDKSGDIPYHETSKAQPVITTHKDPNLLTPYDSIKDLRNLIPVGLLVMKHPDGKDISLSAWQGAELAIEEGNKNGGYIGKQFKLIVRSCDGPWGMGSKQTVNLAFTEQVVAILGSVDGRNSHLIEQVIAKTHVPAVGCLATEPTITEAFVPWFFRCVPNDRQQADILSEYVYAGDKSLNVNIISFGDYDSGNAAKAFNKTAKEKGLKIPIKFESGNNNGRSESIADSILLTSPDAVIFFGAPAESQKIINIIRAGNSSIPVYGNTWAYYGDTLNSWSQTNISGLRMIAPFYMKSGAGLKFVNSYRISYGYSPDLAAAYAYDGMQVILKAISYSGPDRQKIRDKLALIEYKTGITGPISFDKHGNLVMHSQKPRISLK